MAVTMTATLVPADYACLLRITGLTVGKTYDVFRSDPVAGGYRLIWAFTATLTSRDKADMLLPFGHAVDYKIQEHGSTAVLARAGSVLLPYSPTTTDTPLWDAASAGSWPILRSTSHPDTQWMRLPVTDYDADFGFRAHVQPIMGSQHVSVARDVMTAKQGRYVVLTPSVYDRRRLINLLRETAPLHLRAPCVDGLGDLCHVVLDVRESIPLKSRPLLRAWEITYQSVALPAGFGMSSASSAYRTWDDIRTDYTDWDDVKASNADWDAVKMKPAVDIMQGDVPILDSAELW